MSVFFALIALTAKTPGNALVFIYCKKQELVW